MSGVQHVAGDFLSWLSYMAATTSFVKLNPTVPQTTHYRMDGGKLAIDPVMTEEFLKAYAAALDAGEVLSVVERRTDVYKMHYDLDVLDTQPWSEEQIVSVLKEVRTAMAECFPPERALDLFRTVVLVAPPKQVNGMWKTGVHVIYPDLQVDSAMGLTLRKMAVLRLNRLQRRVEPLNAWDDVLDRCVHVANGLRMVGSVKMAKCGQCAAKRKRLKNVGFDKFVLCDDCNGKTLVNDGRAYTPLVLLNALGVKDAAGTEALRQDRYLCVKMSSIRCFSPVGVRRNPHFVLPPGVALEEPSGKAVGGKANVLVVSRKAFQEQDKKRVQGNSRLVPVLETFINTSPLMSQLAFTTPNNPYRDVSVVKVIYHQTRTGKGMMYLVNVEGPGSTFCHNKNGAHNSSKVFFEIRDKCLVQRCFCNKAPPDGGVPCREYKSPKVMLPQDLRLLLFPPPPSKAIDVPVEQLRNNVSKNMSGVAVAVKKHRKQRESAFLQACWLHHKKRVEYLEHLGITCTSEAVPVTKDVMYPSRVSSQLCKFTSEQVDTATAEQLFLMTDSVVCDLKPPAPQKGQKRKRNFGRGAGRGAAHSDAEEE